MLKDIKTLLSITVLLLVHVAFAQQKLTFERPTYAGETLYYEGEVKDGKANGYGSATTSFKHTYKGEWKDNDFHGQGTHTWGNGEEYSGTWVNGQRTGEGTYTWPNGIKYKGSFLNGKQHGKGKMVWPDGGKYEGNYQDGKQHGKGTQVWADGGSYDGEWQNGIQHGKGVQKWPNGSSYDGEYQNGQKHGKGTLVWGAVTQWKGDRYEGEFVNNMRTGSGTYFWSNGDQYVGKFHEDQLHGYGKKTYINGTVEEGNWSNNVFQSTPDVKQTAEDALASRDIWIKGMDYAQNGQFDLAIQEYNQAIQMYPTMHLYFTYRGLAYSGKSSILAEAGNNSDAMKASYHAIEDYTKSIELEPNNAQAYMERGKENFITYENQKALQDLTFAIGLDKMAGKYVTAYWYRSKVYEEFGLTQEARADMQKYEELSGTKSSTENENTPSANSYLEKGNVHFQKQEYALAITEFTKALQINPNFSTAYFNRALATSKLSTAYEDRKKAMEDVNKAIQLDPKLDLAYNLRGSLYMQWKEYDKALQDLNKAIELKPNDAIRYKVRSIIYNNLQQSDKAMDDMKKYYELGGK